MPLYSVTPVEVSNCTVFAVLLMPKASLRNVVFGRLNIVKGMRDMQDSLQSFPNIIQTIRLRPEMKAVQQNGS